METKITENLLWKFWMAAFCLCGLCRCSGQQQQLIKQSERERPPHTPPKSTVQKTIALFTCSSIRITPIFSLYFFSVKMFIQCLLMFGWQILVPLSSDIWSFPKTDNNFRGEKNLKKIKMHIAPWSGHASQTGSRRHCFAVRRRGRTMCRSVCAQCGVNLLTLVRARTAINCMYKCGLNTLFACARCHWSNKRASMLFKIVNGAMHCI